MPGATYGGGCLCGYVRYRVTGVARDVCFCHCVSCRRACGAPFVAWATFDAAAFVVEQGELAQYRSSQLVVRGFCPRCGTALTYSHQGRAFEIDITLVSLDVAGALAPQDHIWVRDKLAWIALNDGLPQYATVRGMP
jgi:hypothetical protein